MHQSYTTAAPGQLHATLPGPDGTHACLTLYDVCPHTTHSIRPSSQYKDPYLHCDLPSLPPVSNPRTIEYIDNKGRSIIETTRTSLSPIHHPQEKAMAASLAPLVLSRHSPVMRHIRESTAAPPLRSILKAPSSILPSMPKIYLLTFSTDRTPTTRAFAALLNEHLPRHIPLLYTIDARNCLVPPKLIQEAYSGVSTVVQDEILRDSRARKEIDHAVDELMRVVKHGGGETSIAICCTAGTHRSVAIAELIALGVRREVRRCGSREGVKIVVRHIHRVKGPKDPY
ncbi:hypothetical protein BU25DRAFT_460624 [Macroventuria anomochaeta]|uniref:Uncharacterized protein n=1 Tax=Macroventuria anomochaeta TaxID=301207 RepID=A0ACB6RVI5_9PLEO|nr:uncharacterized protein BU25DRAFT_460624 [Macroventuria anomochaeta]KAF2625154.1 hypothetical protein BU25DRAFT_460624 [Macroventuria anomochaeta]